MKFRIITPSKIVAEIDANLVTMHGSKGMFGVMPGHAKFTTNIVHGVIKADTKAGKKVYYAHGGVVQVSGEELNVLSDFAEDLGQTRASHVKDRINELTEHLKELESGSLEYRIVEGKIHKYESLLKAMS